MPVVLNQHFLPTDRVYEDVEYSLYHFPREYFARVRPYDRFIYYRPLGRATRRPDSKHYFGLGAILDQQRTAFLLARDGVIEPMNETARGVPFIG